MASRELAAVDIDEYICTVSQNICMNAAETDYFSPMNFLTADAICVSNGSRLELANIALANLLLMPRPGYLVPLRGFASFVKPRLVGFPKGVSCQQYAKNGKKFRNKAEVQVG